ncbi:hypothetical protein CsSME_00005406 [Camellia sinensis var. sinensis]
MIKRRFYRHEHGDRNSGSDSSSSSSDSELEAEAAEETEAEDDVAEVKEYRQSHSSFSGYKSEDSTSANEVDVDSSGREEYLTFKRENRIEHLMGRVAVEGRRWCN